MGIRRVLLNLRVRIRRSDKDNERRTGLTIYRMVGSHRMYHASYLRLLPLSLMKITHLSMPTFKSIINTHGDLQPMKMFGIRKHYWIDDGKGF